jgi:hypothetical protein
VESDKSTPTKPGHSAGRASVTSPTDPKAAEKPKTRAVAERLAATVRKATPRERCPARRRLTAQASGVPKSVLSVATMTPTRSDPRIDRRMSATPKSELQLPSVSWPASSWRLSSTIFSAGPTRSSRTTSPRGKSTAQSLANAAGHPRRPRILAIRDRQDAGIEPVLIRAI